MLAQKWTMNLTWIRSEDQKRFIRSVTLDVVWSLIIYLGAKVTLRCGETAAWAFRLLSPPKERGRTVWTALSEPDVCFRRLYCRNTFGEDLNDTPTISPTRTRTDCWSYCYIQLRRPSDYCTKKLTEIRRRARSIQLYTRLFAVFKMFWFVYREQSKAAITVKFWASKKSSNSSPSLVLYS